MEEVNCWPPVWLEFLTGWNRKIDVDSQNTTWLHHHQPIYRLIRFPATFSLFFPFLKPFPEIHQGVLVFWARVAILPAWPYKNTVLSFTIVKSFSRVRLFRTPWTVACQAPLSMGFSRQEYWSELPFPSPGDLPDAGIEPWSPMLWADSLPSKPPGKPYLASINWLCCESGAETCIWFGNMTRSQEQGTLSSL